MQVRLLINDIGFELGFETAQSVFAGLSSARKSFLTSKYSSMLPDEIVETHKISIELLPPEKALVPLSKGN